MEYSSFVSISDKLIACLIHVIPPESLISLMTWIHCYKFLLIQLNQTDPEIWLDISTPLVPGEKYIVKFFFLFIICIML